MSTYAIGDIQGCFEPLLQLLERCSFDPEKDTLWFTGDLVNRGPHSLETLRFVRSLGERAITVLGNHDLHLLCVALGITHSRKGDTLEEVLRAPDGPDLLEWLRHRPFAHATPHFILVHAGILPQWNRSQVLVRAYEAEQALRGQHYREFLAHIYGNEPNGWTDELTGLDRFRVIVNSFTRLRLCSPEGVMEFFHKGPPENMPKGFFPWYDIPTRQTQDETVIFGHWSALGLHLDSHILALDTGCLWGGPLTAIRLEDRAVFQVTCPANNVCDIASI
jgi:bis(5'-nucleosyl)-tetraphosphatase (symmetrical)